MNILLTGGAGYIGSHISVELLNAGHTVVVIDNFCNSRPEALNRVEKIAGKSITRIAGDVRDLALLDKVFADHPIDAVIHLAGLKSISDSVRNPLIYYDNNVVGTLRLLEAMQKHRIKKLVFSSSATVYGDPQSLPITEDHPLSATNPYGRTKIIIEDMLRDWSQAAQDVSIAILRYFNPVGAHASGLIGEDPLGVPSNLMPYIAQVAIGELERLSIMGNDYPTKDGTGIRDFIHVVDLARGHLKAIERSGDTSECVTINLGTGQGYSVLEILRAFENACGKKIPFVFSERRLGDIAACYADPQKASSVLDWRAEYDIEQMCADHWNWQKLNPKGYS